MMAARSIMARHQKPDQYPQKTTVYSQAAVPVAAEILQITGRYDGAGHRRR